MVTRGRISFMHEGKKRGQVTIFILIAVLVVAAVGAYFLLRGNFQTTNVPASLEPVYESFLACLDQDTKTGIGIIEAQGGYIALPTFEPGSSHMPFSSQLDFLGNQVPYWYYVSGNGIPKEQVPTQSNMENQLGKFIESKVDDCSLESYYDRGFEVSWGTSKADVTIADGSVSVNLKADLVLNYGNDSVVVRNHKVTVDSQLGTLYNSAKKVYDDEQKSLFLEKYGIDALRSYAPVDGIEITCSPKIWNANDVFDDLQEAVELNTLALKSSGSTSDYNVVKPNLNVKEEVRFLNSRNWSNTFEVNPSESQILVSKPVGNQPGLGILGFCYVPYHFVYDMKYPVLVQVSSNDETFQFPMAVVIQGNNPRTPLNGTAVEDVIPELCQYKNTEVQVNVKDRTGAPVEADVSYECFGNQCSIGATSALGVLEENFPQCANGYVLATSSGFKDARYLFSTTQSGSVDVIMDKLYDKKVQLKVDGANYNGDAIVTFTSGDDSKTIQYPQQRAVDLSEGQYEVQVYIYRNSSITIGATTAEQCVTVPKVGVLGAIGLTQERCFNIQVPSQIISNALAGGGTQNYYFLESELLKQGNINVDAKSLENPTTIEQLQNNYALFDENGLDITLN